MPLHSIEVRISEEFYNDLEKMRIATGRADHPEVFRDILNFYDLVLQHIAQGKRLYIGENRLVAVEIEIPLKQFVRQQQSVVFRSLITITVSELLEQALEEARITTRRARISEVVCDAAALYSLVIDNLIAKNHLYIGKIKSAAGEILYPHLERAAGRRTPLRVLDGGKK